MENFDLRKVLQETSERGNGFVVDFREDLDTNINEGKHKFGFKDLISVYKRRSKFNSSKHKNPIAPGLADIVNWVIYDRNSFAQNTAIPANFKFFTQPIGTNNKTKADTNLFQVSRLEDPLWMNVIGMGIYWTPNVYIGDITTFQNTYYLEFWVGQKVYIEGPYQCFPSAAGIYAFPNMNTASLALTFANGAATMFSSNGVPRTDNMFDLRLPGGIQLGYETDSNGNQNAVVSDGLTGITILQGQGFRVENNAPNGGFTLTTTALGGFGINFQCYLYGILSRGVQ
jgi:hypothetical protein